MIIRKQIIPSFFTLLNFFFGFLSLIMTMRGSLYIAAWFILIAVLCDGLDGKLARLSRTETRFGLELDSLGDLLSSGIAPALLCYQGALYRNPVTGFIIIFFYVFSGGYRLARFNVVDSEKERSGSFEGLPLPVASFTVASLWIFKPPFGMEIPDSVWIILLPFLSCLMLSTIPYQWPGLNFKGSIVDMIWSVFKLFLTGIMFLLPHRLMFPLFMCFIFYHLIRWISKKFNIFIVK